MKSPLVLWIALAIGLIAVGSLVALNWRNAQPVDFVHTFYPAAKYLLHDQPVYSSDYTFPTDGTQHPPYNPIWILYAAVPLSVFPVDVAGALRLMIDLASLPLLAYLSARWANLGSVWRGALLAVAPWFSIMLYSGQWAGLALIGAVLCYWGAQRSNAFILAGGILLAASRPNMMELIVLAAIILAWRARIFFKTLAILFFWFVVFSLQQPFWFFGLLQLYLDRFVHPRPADSILLLPGWPWAHFGFMIVGVIFLIAYLWKSNTWRPTPWMWSC